MSKLEVRHEWNVSSENGGDGGQSPSRGRVGRVRLGRLWTLQRYPFRILHPTPTTYYRQSMTPMPPPSRYTTLQRWTPPSREKPSIESKRYFSPTPEDLVSILNRC